MCCKMKITEKMIADMMTKLKISREEAIEVIKFDNEEIESEEVKKIEAKIVDKKPKKDTLAKVKTMKAKKKADAVKNELIDLIEKFMDENEEFFIKPQKMSANKFTFTAKDGSYYSLTLTKHKAKPDGYAGE